MYSRLRLIMSAILHIFLTEHVGERVISSVLYRAAKWRKTDQSMEGGRSQTGAEEHNLEVTQKNTLEEVHTSGSSPRC